MFSPLKSPIQSCNKLINPKSDASNHNLINSTNYLQNIKNNKHFKEKVIENIKNKFNFHSTFADMKRLNNKSIISKLLFLKDRMRYEGTIDMKQYKKILTELDLNIPKNQAEVLFKMSDKTCSGTLNSDEINMLIIKLSKIT